MLEKNNNDNSSVWSSYFNKQLRGDFAVLRPQALHATESFMRRFQTQDLIGKERQGQTQHLNDYYSSPQGRALCVELVKELQALIVTASAHALPAHDLYQVQLDVAEALRFDALEKPQGFHGSFLISAIAHDIGRLLEGALYDPNRPHHEWIPHAQLSFLLLESVLDQDKYITMPRDLKWHLQYAVLAHSGANSQTYIGQMTQAVDRWSGVHGPQGFMRAVAFVPLFLNGQIGLPKDDKDYAYQLPSYANLRSSLQVLEFFGRNMYDDVGDKHAVHRQRITAQNMAILLKWSEGNADMRHVVFAPEIRQDGRQESFKQLFNQKAIAAGEDVALQYPSQNKNMSAAELADELIADLQRPKSAARLSDDMKQKLTDAVTSMSDAERMSFGNTLSMVRDMLAQAHADDAQIIQAACESRNPMCQAMAEWVSSPNPPNLPKPL